MGRGGKRAGAGRPRTRNVVVGFPDGEAMPPGATPPAPPVLLAQLLEPPADLREGQPAPGLNAGVLPSEKDFWRRYAPAAIDQQTLVPSTVHGFRELCELAAFKEEYAARLAKYGSDGKTGDQRMRMYTKLSQRVDAALARFKLTAFGKPIEDGAGGRQRESPSNPWAQVSG